MKTHETLKENQNLDLFYNQDYYDAKSGVCAGYKGYTFDKVESGFKWKINTVHKYVSTGKLLDIGCAKGFFVQIALAAGYDAYGIDFSDYAINIAKQLVGNRVQLLDIEKVSPFPPESFNIITAWDFLEHLKDPEGFLKKVNAALMPDGYLFLTTLNYSSLMSRLMPNNWSFLHPLHISYSINPVILKTWLQNAKFRPIQINTGSLDLKPLPNQLRFVQRSLSGILNLATPLINQTRLGDIIFCIAKKLG